MSSEPEYKWEVYDWAQKSYQCIETGEEYEEKPWKKGKNQKEKGVKRKHMKSRFAAYDKINVGNRQTKDADSERWSQ